MSYTKFLDALGQYITKREQDNLPTQSINKDREDVRDIWIRERRYKELISYILENFDSGHCDNFIKPLETALIKEQNLSLYKQLWKGVIRHRLNDLWNSHKMLLKKYSTDFNDAIIKGETSNFGSHESGDNFDIRARVAYRRAFTLDGLKKYKKGFLKLSNDPNEIAHIDELVKSITNLEKPKSKPTRNKRKIDEGLFWELIDSSRSQSQDKFEFIEKLQCQLETFHPNEIRKFEKLFLIKFNELNTWDLWALAYIVRRGCGDDEFDYFKSWVISKGQKAFEDIKRLNTKELSHLFADEDPQLEEFMYLAEQVYEQKTNDLMKPVKVKERKITGTGWDEENLEYQFPELCKLFK